jgi:hypothetical protein
MRMKHLIRFADYAGMAASILCLVHCLAMPLLLGSLPVVSPLLGLNGEHHALHDALLVGVTVPVLLALVPGFLAHRDAAPLLLGGAGLGCFLVAVLIVGPGYGQGAETVLAVLSSVLLIAAHRRNHRFCKACCQERHAGTAHQTY